MHFNDLVDDIILGSSLGCSDVDNTTLGCHVFKLRISLLFFITIN